MKNLSSVILQCDKTWSFIISYVFVSDKYFPVPFLQFKLKKTANKI